MNNINKLWTFGLLFAASQSYGMVPRVEVSVPSGYLAAKCEAAARGDCDALCLLGDQLYAKITPETNSQELDVYLQEAMVRYLSAAEKGHVLAYVKMGNCHTSYMLAATNPEERHRHLILTMVWYRLAADQGQAIAQEQLGAAYFDLSNRVADLSLQAELRKLAFFWFLKGRQGIIKR